VRVSHCALSRLQIAEVIAAALTSPAAVANKTLEVTAEEDAPAAPIVDLLEAVPQEVSPDEVAARMAEIGDARNKAEGLAAEAEKLEEQLAIAEERKVLAEKSFSQARGALQSARAEVRAAFPQRPPRRMHG
jgi:hypothetical protein